MTTVTVVVIDEWRMTAELIADYLDEAPDIEVVGVGAATDDPDDYPPCDVAVVPDRLLKHMLARPRAKAFLAVIDPAAAAVAARALRAGARGVVVRREPVPDLIGAIMAVAAGETRVPAELLADVINELARSPDGSEWRQVQTLTPREGDILALVGQGLTRRQIAEVLVLSEHTVRSHMQHVMAKLRVHSQLEAAAVARRAVAEGWLKVPQRRHRGSRSTPHQPHPS